VEYGAITYHYTTLLFYGLQTLQTHASRMLADHVCVPCMSSAHLFKAL